MNRARCAPALLLLCAFGAAGCTLALRPGGGEPPSAPPPAVSLAGPVEVRAGAADAGRIVEVTPYDVRIDYAEFATAAVRRLQAAIAGQATVGDSPKSLEVVILYIDVLRTAGSFACLIDVRVTMGDGEVRGVQARDASWNYQTACRAAVTGVAAATLNDAVVARYLSESAVPTPTPAPTPAP